MANITRKCCSLNMALALNILQCDTFTRIEPKIVRVKKAAFIFLQLKYLYIIWIKKNI